jgi:hypothetical protein
MKPAYNGAARAGFFHVAGRLRLIELLEIALKILGIIKPFR